MIVKEVSEKTTEGVTTIPNEIAAEVAEVGDAYMAAEMVIMNALTEFGPDWKKPNKRARKGSGRWIC
jgi:hypothetical protein